MKTTRTRKNSQASIHLRQNKDLLKSDNVVEYAESRLIRLKTFELEPCMLRACSSKRNSISLLVSRSNPRSYLAPAFNRISTISYFLRLTALTKTLIALESL